MHGQFLPMGAITGIGSLPMVEAQSAVDFVADTSPLIPFWPQLPRRSGPEGMIEQGLGTLVELLEARSGTYGYDVKPGALDLLLTRLQSDCAAFDAVHASGFFAFVEAYAAGRFVHARAVKGQIVGPITLASVLFDRGRSVRECPAVLQGLSAYIARQAEWQVAVLRRFKRPVMLFVDEPGLFTVHRWGLSVDHPGFVDALRSVLTAIRLAGAMAGVHCCGPCPWSFVQRVQPDIFSFDASQTLTPWTADRAARAYVQSGGQLAFGLIPTQDHTCTPEALFRQWYTAASRLGGVHDVARQSLITATCGLGGLDVSRARRSFLLAAQVAERVAQLATGNAE